MGGGSFLGGRSACEDSAALAVGAEPVFGCLGSREVAEVVPFFWYFCTRWGEGWRWVRTRWVWLSHVGGAEGGGLFR